MTKNVWDKEQVKAFSYSPTMLPYWDVSRQDPEQAYGSQSHHANHPVPHKGHHCKPCLLGAEEDCAESGTIPQGQPLASSALGQISGGPTAQHTSVKGWRRGVPGNQQRQQMPRPEMA